MGGNIRKIVALDGADPTFEHEGNLTIVCLNIGGLHVDKLMRHGRRSDPSTPCEFIFRKALAT